MNTPPRNQLPVGAEVQTPQRGGSPTPAVEGYVTPPAMRPREMECPGAPILASRRRTRLTYEQAEGLRGDGPIQPEQPDR